MGIKLAILLVFFVGECLGGLDDTKMAALRDAFEAAGSLPFRWSEGVSGDSCGWPGVTCTDGYVTRLNFFDARLTILPSEIGSLTSLSKLVIERNQLAILPPEIGSLTSLTELYLDENQLAILPPEIGNLTSLTELRVERNRLTSLPPAIGSLTLLKYLRPSNNQLTSVPPEIGNLTLLTNLNLGNNQLTSLPPEIRGLTLLTNLILDNNQLTSLPPEIGSLTLLTNLILDNNQLTSLPPEIGSLTSLQRLDLSNNQLTSLPPEIGSLTSLTDLDLSNNQLTSLPPEIGSLTSLTDLRLNNNQLTSLPPEMGSLTSLLWLRLNNNQLTSLPPEIGSLTSLLWLELNNNQLTSLPPEIGSLTSLQYLELNNNQLTSLPPEIGSLTSLQYLELNNNQLTSLPPEIGSLTSLQRLVLANNQLTSLLDIIDQMTTLETLDVHANKLTVLQWAQGRMDSLKRLDASSNQLRDVSLSGLSLNEVDVHDNDLTEIFLTSTPALLWLDASHNRLQSFSMGESNVLTQLDISGNQLADYSFLEHMTSLGTLDTSDNPFRPNQKPPEMPRLRFLTAHNCFHDDLSSLELELSPNLSVMDLSDSPGLTGVLPDALGQLAYLRILRLRNTSLSSIEDPVCESADPHPCVPSFLEPGPLVTRTRDRHFSCYEPRPLLSHSTQSSLLIEIDWDAYFQNQLCRCHSGFVGRLATCHACPTNSECPGDDDQTVMIPAHGYWASVSGNMSSVLEDLALDEVCPSSSSLSWLSICPLVSRSMCSPSVPRSSDNRESEFHLWTPCASGYTGRLCTGCMEEYTRWGSRCYACPTSGVTWAIYSTCAVCVVLVGILLWLWLRKDVNTNTIKTLLFFTQVLALLPSLGISVPSSAAGVSEVSSVSSLTIPGVSCVWKGYDELSSFWFKWTLFLAIVTLVCCGNAIRTRFWGRSGTVTAGLIFLMTAFYLPLSSLVLRSLRCEWDSCLGESFFVSMPHLSCEADRAVAVRVMAWTLVPVFVLGVPVCLGWMLWRARRSRGRLEDPEVRARIGQLYLCYTEERWWWEASVTLRRLLIAASASLIPMESGITPFALFLFFLVSMELQRALQPYRSVQENRLEFGTLLFLEVNVVGVFSLGASERSWARQFVAALLVILDVSWILVLAGVSVRSVAIRLRAKVDAGELDIPLVTEERREG